MLTLLRFVGVGVEAVHVAAAGVKFAAAGVGVVAVHVFGAAVSVIASSLRASRRCLQLRRAASPHWKKKLELWAPTLAYFCSFQGVAVGSSNRLCSLSCRSSSCIARWRYTDSKVGPFVSRSSKSCTSASPRTYLYPVYTAEVCVL